MSTIESQIEERLAATEPEVEVLLAEEISRSTIRLFIDHPAGVTLGLCERVTVQLRDLLEQHGLEVSSPGPRRPLRKPAHFQRFVGRRARVRTRCDGAAYTGELVSATNSEVTIATDTGLVSIPYADIHRSNLVEG